MDDLVESYYLTQFGDDLGRQLACYEVEFGPLAIFVRRLAWIPLNMPVRLDDGPVMNAGEILTDTFEDAQVLIGCWVNASQFAALATLHRISLCDVELFEGGGASFLGTVLYFETCLGQVAVSRKDGRTLPPLAPFGGVELSRPSRDLTNVESILGGDSRVTLKDEALTSVQPIALTSLSHGSPLSTFTTEKCPVESLDAVLAGHDVVFICHDNFACGEPSALSSITTVADAPADLSTTWGTVFGFNDHWDLTLCAAKGRNEPAWRILKPAGERHFDNG